MSYVYDDELPMEREYNAYKRRVLNDPKTLALPPEDRERAIARKMLGLPEEKK